MEQDQDFDKAAARAVASMAFQNLVDDLVEAGAPESKAISHATAVISEHAKRELAGGANSWLGDALLGAAYLVVRLPAIDSNPTLATQVKNAMVELVTLNPAAPPGPECKTS